MTPAVAPISMAAVVTATLMSCLSTPARYVPGEVLTAGADHACAIDAAHHLWCWGRDAEAQLGDGQTDEAGPVPRQVILPSPEGWTDVAAAGYHTCGLDSGKVACWGDAGFGAAVPNQSSLVLSPTVVDLPAGVEVEHVFAGRMMSCALSRAHELYCWGRLDGSANPPAGPSLLTTGGAAVRVGAVALGDSHGCAVTDDAILCWGDNRNFQAAAAGDTIPFATPALRLAGAFTAITARADRSCAIGTAGALTCWGFDRGGAGSASPQAMDTRGSPLRDAALGDDHLCVLGTSGEVRCQGTNEDGALGGTFRALTALPSAPVVGDVVALVAGDGFTCARDRGHVIQCWGRNAYGELGNGEVAASGAPRQVPVPLGGGATILELVVSSGHSCVRTGITTGPSQTFCWGDNRAHQIDPSAAEVEPGPIAITTPASDFRTLAAGTAHTCGLVSPTEARCWGDDTVAQLGRPTPGTMAVTAATLIGGAFATCAGTTCWGSFPPAVNGGAVTTTGWTTTAFGDNFIVGYDNNTLEVVGIATAAADAHCAIARPPGAEITTPQPIAGTSSVTEVAAAIGGSHTCTLNGVATLWCWGRNDAGQLGPAASADACTAAGLVIPPPSGVAWRTAISHHEIALAARHTCALDATDHAYCWGAPDQHASGADRHGGPAPRAISPLQRWWSIATATGHTCAISFDQREVWCWGENRHGEVGAGPRFLAEPHAVTFRP